MLYFLLYITLHAGVGDIDKITLGGRKLYPSFEHCRTDGQTIANWLTQPDIIIEIECRPVEARRSKAHADLPLPPLWGTLSP